MLFIAVIFILAPLLTEIAILAIHGRLGEATRFAVPEIVLEDLKYCSYVVVLACVDLDFCALRAIGFVYSYWIFSWWVLSRASSMSMRHTRFLRGTPNPSLDDSRYVASTFALIAFAVTILAYQYRRRTHAVPGWGSVEQPLLFS